MTDPKQPHNTQSHNTQSHNTQSQNVQEEAQAAYLKLNARPCSVLQVGGFRPTGDPLASRIGGAAPMPEAEAWPLDLQGKPMEFIAALNLQAAPYTPPALEGFAMLTFFVGSDFIESGCEKGTWELRTYRDLSALQPTLPPSEMAPPNDINATWVTAPFEARWLELAQDCPCCEEARLPEGMSQLPDWAYDLNLRRTKLGGCASAIQHKVIFLEHIEQNDVWQPHPDEPNYVCQIASEDKAGLWWVDDGVVYLGRHPDTGEWQVSCQFY